MDMGFGIAVGVKVTVGVCVLGRSVIVGVKVGAGVIVAVDGNAGAAVLAGATDAGAHPLNARPMHSTVKVAKHPPRISPIYTDWFNKS
jgi:hypothetical protein